MTIVQESTQQREEKSQRNPAIYTPLGYSHDAVGIQYWELMKTGSPCEGGNDIWFLHISIKQIPDGLEM